MSDVCFFSIHSFGQFQFSSVTQSCPTLCHPMNRSMPGLPVHHQLLEITQTHVHQVSDAIQPSHPLSPPSPPAPNPSQHQGLSNESICSLKNLPQTDFAKGILKELQLKPHKEKCYLLSKAVSYL